MIVFVIYVVLVDCTQVSVEDTLGQLSAWLNIESYVVATSTSDDPKEGQLRSFKIPHIIDRL